MSTFTDDFNRPDGGLGNGWVGDYGSATLVSGHLSSGGSVGMRQTQFSGSGRQEAIATLTVSADGSIGNGPMLKMSNGTGSGYVAHATGSLASPTWTIRRVTAWSFVTILSIGGSGLTAGERTIRFVYDQGVLSLWVAGYFIGSVADSTHGALTGAGWWQNTGGAALNAITYYGDEGSALSVSPNPLGNYGGTYPITFTGVATNWTAGTPGSPVFTVDHGTLANQTVDSTTAAHADYTPGNFLGTATFADPSSGATCQVTVTSNIEIVPPGSGFQPKLTDEGAATINRAAVIPGDQTVLTDLSVVIPGALGASDLTMLNAISDLWYAHYATWAGAPPAQTTAIGQILWQILNGSADPPVGPFLTPPPMPLAHLVQAVRDLFLNTEGTDYLTIQQVLDAVSTPDLGAVRDDLGIEGNGTWTSILQVLLGMWGLGADTLTSLGDDLRAFRGLPLYTVQDILDAISALPQDLVDLSPVLTAISNLRGGTETVGSVYTLLDSVRLTAEQTQTSLGALRTPDAHTLGDVLDAIAALPGQIGAGGTPGAPVWPGLAGVTLGASVALEDGAELTGPLDGVLLTITSAPARAGRFAFGDLNSWRYVGAVVFQTDRGDWEWAQPIGLDAQIVTPKTMLHAAAARVRVESTWSGTLRPFTVNA